MKINILTLFPDMINNIARESIIGRACEGGLLEINAVDIRDYTDNKHNRVDDYTYGGGAGMLMRAEPVYRAYEAAVLHGEEVSSEGKKPRLIYVTPQGQQFNQALAQDLAAEEEFTILCGHYEGIDERVLEEIVTDYVSIGDYVLTGGELAAMIIADAAARLVPGVLGNDGSAEIESFHRDLLEYPQYSRPEVWHGKAVPPVLLSGNKKEIEGYRLQESIKRTKERRPDLYEKYKTAERAIALMSRKKRDHIHMIESLKRGRSKVAYMDKDMIILKDYAEKIAYVSVNYDLKPEGDMLAGMTSDEFSQLLYDCDCILSMDPDICSWFNEKLGFFTHMECLQYYYSLNLHRNIKGCEIKPSTMDDLDYICDHYDNGDRDYIINRISHGCMFSCFCDGVLAGFIGEHSEGSGGLLYVDRAFRGRGLATQLEQYLINRSLDRGETCYGHIKVGNDKSVGLQNKLGLILSDKHLFWQFRNDGYMFIQKGSTS